MWYLIGRKWVKKWLNYEDNVKPVDGMIPIPPPIDNSDIMDFKRSRKLFYRKYSTIHVHKNNECITEELVMGRDFAIFNEAAWDKLVEWYGIKEGTVVFQRIANNDSDTLHLRNISLCLYPKSTIAKFQIYKNNLCDHFNCFNHESKIIELFDHDTEPQKLTAVKIAFKIPLSSEIIIIREVNRGCGTRHPITKKKYKVISSIVSSYNGGSFFSRFKGVANYLVALKSKEIWWLRV